MKKVSILILLILFISHLNLSANEIRGFIKEQTSHEPLAGVSIYIAQLKKGTYSKPDGSFNLKNLPEGKFEIRFSYIGYESKYLTTSTAEKGILEVFMEERAIDAEEVVITGMYERPTEQHAIKIDVLRTERYQYVSPTLMDGLTEIPGVEQTSFGPGIGKPVIRGLSFSRVLTIYQSSRFENQQWGHDHGLAFADAGISRIEVIKGPASLIYGSGAIGGVINIIDERPALDDEVTGDINLSGHSNTLGLSTDAGIKAGLGNGWYTGLRLSGQSHADYSDGNNRTIGNSRWNAGGLKSHIGLRHQYGNSKLSYSFRREWLGFIEEDEIEESLATSRNDRQMQLPFQEVTDHHFSLQNDFYFGNSKFSLNTAFHTNIRKEIEDDFDEIDLGLELNTFNYDLRWQLPTRTETRVITGLQGMYQSNTNMEDADEILIPDAHLYDYAAYLMASHEINSFILQGGIRYDYRILNANSERLPTYILPGEPEDKSLKSTFDGFTFSAGTVYDLSQAVNLRLNVASGFRAPDLAELYSNGEHPGTGRFEIGDESFGREQNIEFDISADYRLSNLTFELAGFYNLIDNFIFFNPTEEEAPEGYDDLTVWRFEQENVVLYGGEAGFEYKADRVLPNLTVASSFSLVIAETRTGQSALPLIPPHRFNHKVSYEHSSLGFMDKPYIFIRLQNILKQNRTGEFEDATPAYNLISLGTGFKFKNFLNQASFNVNVNNLLNESYYEHLSAVRPFEVKNMGRDISVSLRIPI